MVLGMWFLEAIGGDGATLMRTLDRCAQALKRWGKDTFGYIAHQVLQTQRSWRISERIWEDSIIKIGLISLKKI